MCSVQDTLAAIVEMSKLDPGPVGRQPRPFRGSRSEDAESPEDSVALTDGHQRLAGDVRAAGRLLRREGNPAARVARESRLGRAPVEPHDRAADEVHADDLVLVRAPIRRQQADGQSPLGSAGMVVSVD